MFRKKGLIYAGVILAVVVIFEVFFMNMLVKMAIVGTGKMIFGAKVDVKSVSIDVFKSKLDIRGLVVADKSKEYKNLFEVSDIDIDIMVLPLLEKKFIVDDISVVDLVLGTDRTTSGFLPVREVKKAEKKKADSTPNFASKLMDSAKDKAKDEIKQIPASKLADLKDMKNIDYKQYVKKENLESYKAAQTAKENINTAKAKADASIKSVDADAKIKAARESLNKVKETKISGVADIAKGQQALTELDNIKKSTDELLKSVNNAKEDSQALITVSKSSVDSINAAKDKDVQDVMSKVNINVLDSKNVEKSLIGPVWYDRISKMLQFADMANKYIPVSKKKAKKQRVVARGAGREIVFLEGTRYPSFWIKKTSLSTSGSGKSQYAMKGEIDDIAIEQSVIGKPLTFTLSLDNPSQTIKLNGSINHMDGRNDSITAEVSNLPASAAGLDKVDFGNIKIKSANTAYEMDLKSTEEALELNGKIKEKNVEFTSPDANNIAFQALSGLDAFNVNIAMKNSDKNSDISVTSDIADRLKKALDKIYGKKISEAKASAKKAVEDAVKDEVKSVTGLGDSASADSNKQVKGLNDKVAGLQSEVDKAKNDITAKMAGGSKSNVLKGLFK
jgi:uncharacterized protein (TIGR03545 family)